MNEKKRVSVENKISNPGLRQRRGSIGASGVSGASGLGELDQTEYDEVIQSSEASQPRQVERRVFRPIYSNFPLRNGILIITSARLTLAYPLAQFSPFNAAERPPWILNLMCGSTNVLKFQLVNEVRSTLEMSGSVGSRSYTFTNNCNGRNRFVKIVEEKREDRYLLCKIQIAQQIGGINSVTEMKAIFLSGTSTTRGVLTQLAEDMRKFQSVGPSQCAIMGGEKIVPK